MLAFLGLGITPNELAANAQKQSGEKKQSGKNGSSKAKQKTKAKAKTAENKLPWPENILSLVGDGAVLVVDHHSPDGTQKELYALNPEKSYVPASILKIVTSGAALEFFGSEYRFKTDFLLTKSDDLWIIGYGDPYLVSEELLIIIDKLKERGLKKVNNIYIDGSYFEQNIVLDGNTKTSRAYDAYNVAFGVNFNTINFRKNKKGQVLKTSDVIPLTPMALESAAKVKGSGNFRLNINESPLRAELHAGQTFKCHLEEAGIPVVGEIIVGQKAPKKRKVFYCHESSKTLDIVIKDLMEYSNNFMTNQLFLAMGAELYGAPASLEKSQMAMNKYFEKYALSPIVMGDGSGLSRQTTITARQMAEILKIVESERYLFSKKDNGKIFYKTGTMSDIKTLAGYMERPDSDQPLSFVILLNGANYQFDTREKILDILKSEFISSPSGGS